MFGGDIGFGLLELSNRDPRVLELAPHGETPKDENLVKIDTKQGTDTSNIEKKGTPTKVSNFKKVDLLRKAEAVAFLKALREVGDLRLEKIGEQAFVLRFDAVTSMESLKESLFFEEEVPLEKMFERYGPDLFQLIQGESNETF